MTAQPPSTNLPQPAPGSLPPSWYPHPLPAPRTSVLAVIALVAGLIWFFWLGSVVAIVTGHLARREVREQGLAGDALAITGLVLGYLGAATFGLFIVFPILIAAGTR